MISYADIVQALKDGEERHPELADLIGMYCSLLEIQDEANLPTRQPTLAPVEAQGRLERGEPLVSPDEVEADPAVLAELCARIGFAIAERKRERVNELARIHAWFYERRERIGALAAEYLRSGHLSSGNGPGIDAGMLTFVFNASLRPFLRAQAQALAPLVEKAVWYRGYCPICGGEPDMAALEKAGGQKRLICSRCDTEWAFRRLGCPYCGNEEAAQLAYFPSDDQVYRLNVCERCNRYLKTIDLRMAAAEHPLPAERILTAGMDVAAEKAGYRGG
jgi:FdhE protein